MKDKLQQVTGVIEQEKKTLLANLDQEFQKHQAALGVVVQHARDEFGQLKGSLRELYGQADDVIFNVLNIAWRSYFLNVAANPLVYSFVSARFRNECRALYKDFRTALRN